MKFGICNVNIAPVRHLDSDASEMVTQLLFGDCFKVLEQKKQWLYIKIAFDGYQGWIDEKQITKLDEGIYNQLNTPIKTFANDLINFATDKNNHLIPLSLGARLTNYSGNSFSILDQVFEFNGKVIESKPNTKENIVTTASLYLNAPYLWGGKSPFGIDCSGFTQMVYKLNGHKLFRDASQQAKQGEVLSFIEESVPGDLAFFDNEEGIITHVGIILTNNFIIHASGKVRLDRLDQSGIFNEELNKHTHKLRLIKRMF